MSKARTPESIIICLLALGGIVGCQTNRKINTATPIIPATPTTIPPTATFEPTSTPEPTATKIPKKTLIDMLRLPIDKQALTNRLVRQSTNPEKYHQQIDERLAEVGTTFLLYVCGIDHEPPMVEKVLICSNSLLVWGRDGKVFMVNFTHDTRMPEQEIAEGILGQEGSARRSDAIWLNRKDDQSAFTILREAYQNATGFPIDYIMVLKSDVAVKDFIDEVLGGEMLINIPIGFTAQPVYVDTNTKLPKRIYNAGPQVRTAQEIYQYLKAVAATTDNPRDLENNVRKEHVLAAILDALAQKKSDPLRWPELLLKLKSFMDKQVASSNIAANFNPADTLTNNLDIVAKEAGATILRGNIPELGSLPSLGGSLYLVDQNAGPTKPEAIYGPGFPWPLIWGDSDSGDPNVRRDVEQLKIYEKGYVAVPKQGDALRPENLPKHYWHAPRQTITWYFLDKKPWGK